jgi:DNA mismatch repair protein MLH3
LDTVLRFDLSRQDGDLLIRFQKHFEHWGIMYEVFHAPEHSLQTGVTVEVRMLPPAIIERCRLEPRLLIDLLREEIWKLHSVGGGQRSKRRSATAWNDHDWVTRFHDCPDGILDLVNSRACRSKSAVSSDQSPELTRVRCRHV